MDNVKYIFNKIMRDCRSRAIVFTIIFIITLWFVDDKKVEHFEDTEEKTDTAETKSEPNFPVNLYTIDIGKNSIAHAKCSKSCCGQQYPTPFDVHDEEICNNQSSYVPVNLNCISDQGAGCLCVTKSQFDFLVNRGNNT